MRTPALHVGIFCAAGAVLASCHATETAIVASPPAADDATHSAPVAAGAQVATPLVVSAPVPPSVAPDPRMATLARLLRSSDTVAVASLRSINNRARAADGLRSTLVFQVHETLKGGLRPDARMNLRFLAGYNPDGTMAQITDVMEVIAGQPEAIPVGERFLIFSSRASYEERARSDGGAALPGATQALGVLRVRGDEAQGLGMNALFLRLTEVRTMLESHDDRKY